MSYDVLAVATHPDDLEVVMGGTAAKLVDRGLRVLFVDLSAGEPARHARPGVRGEQAECAARHLGVDRVALEFRDRLITDGPETRLADARLIRQHRPRMVFTTDGCGVHPDHKATTDITVHGVLYARLPKWDEVPGGEALAGTAPHEIERLFFAHCRMERAWERFDFAIDVTSVYDRKIAALGCYESVFSGDQRELLERYAADDRFVGSQVGVGYAEPFRARSPLLVDDPGVFRPVRFG
jgi:LmbE family N-acetylglucosaminyl deacetylase